MLDLPFQDIKRVEEKILNKRKQVGLAYKTDRIMQIDPRQEGFQYLDTSIHEALHLLCPHWEEDYVEHVATEIAQVIWNQGFRRRTKKIQKSKKTLTDGTNLSIVRAHGRRPHRTTPLVPPSDQGPIPEGTGPVRAESVDGKL